MCIFGHIFISHGIPREHIFGFATKKCSHDSCFEFLWFPDKLKYSMMWRPTVCAIRNRFISHWIPCDSMWNSTWKYLSGLRSKSILIVVISDLYAFRTTSSDLWCGESLYVPSGTVSFHIEFHVIQCEIPREDNFAKKCSHDVCFGSLCFSDKFRCFVKRKPIECVIWYD